VSTRDFAFEALAEVTNTDWETGRGELNAALKAIKTQEPEILDNYLLSCEIHERAKAYRFVMGEGILLTPTALAKHWQRVIPQAPKPTYAEPAATGICPRCDGHKMVFVTDEAVVPCPACNSRANTDFWRSDGSRFVAAKTT